jgi:hypothetical protein
MRSLRQVLAGLVATISTSFFGRKIPKRHAYAIGTNLLKFGKVREGPR